MDMLTTDPVTPRGRVTRTLLGWLMRSARVASVDKLSTAFRLVDLEGDGLKGVAWAPGQKVQVAMGTGFATRTYTPLSWDADAGRTRLLAYLHGDGPGSRWADGLREGAACQLLGPRRSLDLSGLGAPAVLFGDETSFALGASLGARATCVFEATNVPESRSVLEAFGLGRAKLVERIAGGAHLAAVEAELSRHVARGGHVILTGKAPSIQRVSQSLKRASLTSARMKAKAYWAPGKCGLD